MSRISLRDERLERLAVMVAKQGVLKLRAVANDLGVSEMTIRRDVIESGGRFACLGGHVVGAQNDVAASDYVLEEENDHHAAAKIAACAKAAKLIEEDDTIFIDCGTTTPRL